jgi:hypothetical protein
VDVLSYTGQACHDGPRVRSFCLSFGDRTAQGEFFLNPTRIVKSVKIRFACLLFEILRKIALLDAAGSKAAESAWEA